VSVSDELKVERRGHVLVVTIDRQDRLNALSDAVHAGLTETWRAAKDDPDLRALVITGAGTRAFCTGMDLKGVQERGGFRPVVETARGAGHDLLSATAGCRPSSRSTGCAPARASTSSPTPTSWWRRPPPPSPIPT
jgi:enoyl-CoA hydratase/carnithine racemase